MPARQTEHKADNSVVRPGRRTFPVSASLTDGSGEVAFEGRLGRAYNEEPFRHLLGIEQARADRSSRTLLLALITLASDSGETLPFTPRVAARVFDGLWLCTRDVDLTGWYRQDRIVGAALIQDRAMLAAEDVSRIRVRIDEKVRGVVPARLARGLRVRVVQICDMSLPLAYTQPEAIVANPALPH